MPYHPHRKTKIIATVGPSCSKESTLAALIRAGADVLRINASHTTPQSLKTWIRRIRRVTKTVAKPVGILIDLQGPRVRTGRLKGRKRIELFKGRKILIEVSNEPGHDQKLTTSCREFPSMLKAGDPMLIDNGLIKLKVLKILKKSVECEIVTGGILGENKGINLPNAPTTLPSLTPKDLQDIKVAVKENVDFIALSFVRNEHDILALQHQIAKQGKRIPVIAKIEKPKALDRLDAILQSANGLMVARGDLGIELGVEKVPVLQKKLIRRANEASIPVITATQMLESMIENMYPTRAEASDVANAVFDETDAVMLSGETAIGAHPIEAVQMMSQIVSEAEKYAGTNLQTIRLDPAFGKDFSLLAITQAACKAAENLDARAILVFTVSGKTAVLVSKLRWHEPVIALTSSDEVGRRLSLLYGVLPFRIRYSRSTDEMVRIGDQTILERRLLRRGDFVVIVGGRQALPGARYMVKIHQVGME